MKYLVAIIETLRKEVEVDAENYHAAIDAAKDMYDREEVVLSADDFDCVEFYAVKQREPKAK